MSRTKTGKRMRVHVPKVVCKCGSDVFALYSNNKYYCDRCGRKFSQ